MDAQHRQLRVALFGGTGLIGTGILQSLLRDPRVAEVRAFTRRALGNPDPRLLEQPITDFLDAGSMVEGLGEVDALCFALGIASNRVSRQQYETITVEMPMAAASALMEASPNAVFHYVSGAGADERAFMHWARTKARAERELASCGLGGCMSWRPAFIIPNARPAGFGAAQALAASVMRPMAALPDLGVSNTSIGKAMIQASLEDLRTGVLENRMIRRIRSRYRRPVR